MHGRVARYGYSGDARALVHRAEEGMLPIFQANPGFRAYTLMESEGEILSFSAWDSPEQAEAASAAAAEWVAANMAGELTLTETRIGEVLLSTTLGVTTAAAIGA